MSSPPQVARWPLLALLVLAPLAARANSISEELDVNHAQPNSSNPRSGSESSALRGLVDLSDSFDFRFGLDVTHEEPAKTAHALFGAGPANIVSGTVGLDWDLNDSFTLGAEFSYSPSSAQSVDTTLRFDNGAKAAPTYGEGLLNSQSSSLGALLTLDYTTLSPTGVARPWELSLSASGGWTSFSTVQQLTRFQTDKGSESVSALRAICLTDHSKATQQLCRQLSPALRQLPAGLNQFEVDAGMVHTLFETTDLGIHGSYFFYDQDPTQVGFFSTLSTGRSSASTPLGSGVPLAPMLYSLRPSVVHRFGGLSVELWVRLGRYVKEEGSSTEGGARLQYSFSHTWKAWITGSLKQDRQPLAALSGAGDTTSATPATSVDTLSFLVGSGVRCVF